MKKLKSLSEQVYDYIVHQIKLGELPDGARLSEAELINQLEISRTPIREALIQLSSDGILENLQRKGFFVKSYSHQELIENYNIIARLDIYAAELAMDQLSEEDLKQMEALANHMDFAMIQQDYALYSDKQEDFHDIYLRCCSNQHLIAIIHQLQKKYSSPVLKQDSSKHIQAMKEINEMHYQIIDFFRKKDPAGLQTTLTAYWLLLANPS